MQQIQVEQFRIKVILVEPGIIRTNFFENILKVKRALDPTSPYSELLQRRINRVKTMFENSSQSLSLSNFIPYSKWSRCHVSDISSEGGILTVV
ncbi:MAG TPA: hypothetical protein VEH06_02325 [Candidatus Bathyarchaeia archaeon]|nr:hypothetical protein [Candidatus Bathyarchaeia archaeon]